MIVVVTAWASWSRQMPGPSAIGKPIMDLKRKYFLNPNISNNKIVGHILRIDDYGNLYVSGITKGNLAIDTYSTKLGSEYDIFILNYINMNIYIVI